MNLVELALEIKEHGNDRVKKAFEKHLKERRKEMQDWAKKTKSDDMAFLLESLSAGYSKAIRALLGK